MWCNLITSQNWIDTTPSSLQKRNSAKRRLRRPNNKSAAAKEEEEDDAVDALLRFAPPLRFVVVQTFAKRVVLDESVDVVEIDVVIVIAKRLRPVFPPRGVGHEHRESLRGREKRNHGGISAHESERNGEILQRDAISAISGRFDGVWVDEEE